MTASGNGMNSRFPVVNNLYSIHFTPPHTTTTTQCKLQSTSGAFVSVTMSGCNFNSHENQQMDLMDLFVSQRG